MPDVKKTEESNFPLYLFHEGTNVKAYEYMGLHKVTVNGKEGMACRVWAPNAQAVSLVGPFNDWDDQKNPMKKISDGVWECYLSFVPVSYTHLDPPRVESVQAVADAKRAGIRTVMITGDHKVTATAIARKIGIFSDGDMALEGVELDAMKEEELDQKLPKIAVYARVSPENKIRIVDAWQRKGRIVSMTGDGVNDAPALKKADIGVAMGITGTEVSKDAASMILEDDNFATIVKAVLNGRNVYENIKNAIQFLLSGNMAAILSVLFASIVGLPMPFAPVHLLFINLLTDSLPAIAIGMEPARKDLLDRSPRDPKEPILNRSLLGRCV